MEQALNDAVAAAGGQAALAREICVSQPSVWHWINKSKRCSAEYVLKVAAATGVSRHRLRPDIYPPCVSALEDDAAIANSPNMRVEDYSPDRVIVCAVCEQRVDGEIPNACTFVDCPHAQRIAA